MRKMYLLLLPFVTGCVGGGGSFGYQDRNLGVNVYGHPVGPPYVQGQVPGFGNQNIIIDRRGQVPGFVPYINHQGKVVTQPAMTNPIVCGRGGCEGRLGHYPEKSYRPW